VNHGPRIALRPVAAEDEPLLRAAFADARRDGFLAAGLGEREVESLLEVQWRAQDAQYRRAYPHAEHAVVEVDGVPCGRLVLDCRAGEVRVVDIALLAASRGRGIGARLLRSLQDGAALAERRIGLRVARGNPAQRLYVRLGFREVASDEVSVEMAWEAEAAGHSTARQHSNRGAAA